MISSARVFFVLFNCSQYSCRKSKLYLLFLAFLSFYVADINITCIIDNIWRICSRWQLHFLYLLILHSTELNANYCIVQFMYNVYSCREKLLYRSLSVSAKDDRTQIPCFFYSQGKIRLVPSPHCRKTGLEDP
jgi:hypothetical protein